MKTFRNALVLVGLVACGETATPSGDATHSALGTADGCTTQVQPGNRACVPSEAKSNTAITIEVDLTEGCLPCAATMDACSVDVKGTDITVGMQTRTCKAAADTACSDVCAIPSTTCQLPPLAAGTYTVHVAGEASSGLLPRQLVVTDTATTTSCSLARPAPGQSDVDVSRYVRDCTKDEDCSVVIPTICKPCACTAIAIISTANVPLFEADRRAASSQCAGSTTDVECAGCAVSHAYCDIVRGQPSGGCALRP